MAAPVCLRHIPQWHQQAKAGSPVTWPSKAPHMQEYFRTVDIVFKEFVLEMNSCERIKIMWSLVVDVDDGLTM
jgi:hypothetical protein